MLKKRKFGNNLAIIVLLTSQLISITESSAVETNGGTTLAIVNLPDTRTLGSTATSSDFDFSLNLSRPSSGWADDDLIAAEIAITSGTGNTAGADNAPVFRGSGNCMVDVSSSTTSNSFGDTQTSLTINSRTVFILNDRTPQLSLQGQIRDVVEAVKRIRVSCDSTSDLVGKYVRIGIVPTEGTTCSSSTITGATSTITCGQLYYVFSTQHYYRVARSASNQTIPQLFDRARTFNITVNGTSKNAAAIYGWIATLKERDEIILTNRLDLRANGDGTGAVTARTIGTTDLGRTWNWDSSWGGTSQSACTTTEGDFRWLGPDVWCERVPSWNHTGNIYDNNVTNFPSGTDTTSRYWIRTNNLWSPTSQTNYDNHTGMRIDLASSTIPTNESDARNSNGFNVFHSWHYAVQSRTVNGVVTNVNVVDEPNNSGDFIYQGYEAGGNPGWDDASTNSDTVAVANNFYVEYCSGANTANTCAPPDAAVDSIQLKYDQTLTLNTAPAANSEVSTSTTDFRTTSSSDLDITYTSSDTSICSVSPGTSGSGTTVTVTLLWANAYCSITVSQGGNVNFNAATSITRTFLSRYGNDIGLRSLNTLPVDPQVTSYNPKSMIVTSGPTQVLVCLNIASSTDGTLLDGVLRIDVGNIDSSDTSFSASGNDVNISSDRTSAVNISGVLASVNTTLRTTTLTRVSGGRLSGTYYLRIRSVPTTGDSLNVTCSDAAAASTRTFTLRPMSVGRTRSVSVSLNKR